MREFFIVGVISPPNIFTIEPPVNIADFIAGVPDFFAGKTMAIIQQQENTEQFYVLLPSANGFVVFNKHPNYDTAFTEAVAHLLPITDNITMPETQAYN